MRRRFGDRRDGWRLRKVDPFFKVIPHIMTTRNDAQVFFSETIDLEETLKFIREIRKEGYKLGFLHVAIATMVRTISQKPKVNRFINAKKAYARNEIVVAFAIKKEMSENGEETTIKVKFKPTDTIYDVIEKMNKAIDENKVIETQNATDKFTKVMNKVPGFVYGGIIGFLKLLDRIGIMPKSIIELSPFHSSFFITDLGSLGIKPVYHHLYNFGTTSIFMAFGTRNKQHEINDNKEIEKTKTQDVKVVVDERIVDGYYFSQAIKYTKNILENPYILKEKPEKVVVDDEI